MSLHRRITIAGAASVLVAVVLACVASYVAVRAQLLGQIDDQLRLQGAAFARVAGSEPPPPRGLRRRAVAVGAELSPKEGGPLAYVQFVDAQGRLRTNLEPAGAFRLPVTDVDRDVAAGRRGTTLRDARVDDVRLRMLTVRLGGDRGAVQLGRPLNSTERLLGRLRRYLVAILLGGVALAAVLSRLAARRVTAPLREVADAAEHIAEHDDLGRRIDVTSDDELGQLARRFNSMLDRLEASRAELAGSVAAQRQLVADASHELRTPVTSLRTNLEVLLGQGELDDESRERLTADLIGQTEELGALIADLIDLARGDVAPVAPEDVRLDAVVADAVAVAGRHHPDVAFVLHAEPVVVDGAPDRLGRAVGNLLQNAAKHSPRGAQVRVAVDPSGVTVRDAGPGITDEDLPHLFDRFYRGATSRSLPGTGLGLAIVRQVAEAHHGTVQAANDPDGGARFTLSLPGRHPEVTDLAGAVEC